MTTTKIATVEVSVEIDIYLERRQRNDWRASKRGLFSLDGVPAALFGDAALAAASRRWQEIWDEILQQYRDHAREMRAQKLEHVRAAAKRVVETSARTKVMAEQRELMLKAHPTAAPGQPVPLHTLTGAEVQARHAELSKQIEQLQIDIRAMYDTAARNPPLSQKFARIVEGIEPELRGAAETYARRIADAKSRYDGTTLKFWIKAKAFAEVEKLTPLFEAAKHRHESALAALASPRQADFEAKLQGMKSALTGAEASFDAVNAEVVARRRESAAERVGRAVRELQITESLKTDEQRQTELDSYERHRPPPEFLNAVAGGKK